MRVLYNLIVFLLLPAYAAYWLGKAILNRRYRPKIGQRFGLGFPKLERSIWVHAVSVGEVVAAAPLVRALSRRYPEHPVIVTTVTPTGASRVRALFGDAVHQAYIPFELPLAVDNLFESIDPKLAIIIETEIWPNLYHGCGKRGIPLVLASARISPRSVRTYSRFLPLFKETLSHGIVIAAQSEADARRFLALGAAPERTRVTGNIKFDIELPPDLAEQGRAMRKEMFGDRPVWIAASTHDGEEAIVLDVHERVRDAHPDLLLVLVPRHPERFPVVRESLEKAGVTFVTRTEDRSCTPDTTVLLVDTMGEVPLFYAASDVAFVGGSLIPIGGHNLLEPAALGMPIVTGPHMFNAQEIADQFVESDACVMVNDAEGLEAALMSLLGDPEAAKWLGERGRELLETNRGALWRLVELVDPLMK